MQLQIFAATWQIESKRFRLLPNYFGACYQFTLYAVLKGNKPDFHQAMASEQSQAFYQQFLAALRSKYNPDLIKGIYICC